MQTYRQQIDDMENYMAALTGEMSISPQVLAEVIRKLHESFIALAGQIQASHEAVKVQKEQYLNYRKAFLKDTTDVFEVRRRVQSSAKRKVISGPSPFGGMSGSAALAAVAAANAVAGEYNGLGEKISKTFKL
jgi:nucleoporin p58/p45